MVCYKILEIFSVSVLYIHKIINLSAFTYFEEERTIRTMENRTAVKNDLMVDLISKLLQSTLNE